MIRAGGLRFGLEIDSSGQVWELELKVGRGLGWGADGADTEGGGVGCGLGWGSDGAGTEGAGVGTADSILWISFTVQLSILIRSYRNFSLSITA